MNKLVTIIMPVYNAEKYLKYALQDLCKQTYHNLQIICVDDGSTDKSVDIIRYFASKDERIILIQQKNKFAGVARNNGLLHAQGDYLIFLDSDDRFEKKMIQKLVEVSEKENVDIIYFGYDSFNETGTIVGRHSTYFHNEKKRTEEIRDCIFQLDPGAPWVHFYKTSFVLDNNIQFSSTQNCNDIYFTCLNAVLAKEIYFLDKPLVHYRTGNPNSLQGASVKSINSFYTALSSIYEALKQRGIEKDFEDSLKQLYVTHVNFHSNKSMSYETLQEFFKYAEKLFENINIKGDDEVITGHLSAPKLSSIIDKDFPRFVYYKYNSPVQAIGIKKALSILIKEIKSKF